MTRSLLGSRLGSSSSRPATHYLIMVRFITIDSTRDHDFLVQDTCFQSTNCPGKTSLIALVKHHHHHHHPRSNTYAQYQCLGRSPPFVHCWFGSNNSTLDRYLSFWSIPPATSKICFSKKQSGKLKFSLRPRSHLEILRWCRRASTLLQEGQAESRGTFLLSRTWEGEERGNIGFPPVHFSMILF